MAWPSPLQGRSGKLPPLAPAGGDGGGRSSLEVEDHELAGGAALAPAPDQVRVPHPAGQHHLLPVLHRLCRASGASTVLCRPWCAASHSNAQVDQVLLSSSQGAPRPHARQCDTIPPTAQAAAAAAAGVAAAGVISRPVPRYEFMRGHACGLQRGQGPCLCSPGVRSELQPRLNLLRDYADCRAQQAPQCSSGHHICSRSTCVLVD